MEKALKISIIVEKTVSKDGKMLKRPFQAGKTENDKYGLEQIMYLTMDSNEEERIKKLVEEGWNFRRREISGHDYIIAYKGGKEKSLGSFSDEKWNLLQEQGVVKTEPIQLNGNAGFNLLKAELDAVKSEWKEFIELTNSDEPFICVHKVFTYDEGKKKRLNELLEDIYEVIHTRIHFQEDMGNDLIKTMNAVKRLEEEVAGLKEN